MSAPCTLCPRRCAVDRGKQTGFCKANENPKLALAALHLWEEPPISGTNGTGALFFSHCTLQCPFCQNHEISHNGFGKEITVEWLAKIMLSLQQQQAHSISLITPTQYAVGIIEAVALAKQQGLRLPVVYNCGGYESVDTIEMLKGTVDVFLPDFKFFDARYSQRYLSLADYREVATAAIGEMLRTVGPPVLNDEGILQQGVLVRHLLLPGLLTDSLRCVEHLHRSFGDRIYLSLMSQYTPMPQCAADPLLSRRVSPHHYQTLVDFAAELGITQCFLQGQSAANPRFIPEFDLRGV